MIDTILKFIGGVCIGVGVTGIFLRTTDNQLIACGLFVIAGVLAWKEFK